MDRKVVMLVRMLPSNQDRSKWHSLPVWYIWNKLYVMSASIRDNGDCSVYEAIILSGEMGIKYMGIK
jgi:hypothetical protein